jgi:hypothetical protein
VVLKEKLKELTDRGYKVQLRTRWSDNAWDVWIYKYNAVQKERPAFDWDEDIEKALDKAIKRLEVTDVPA